MKEGWVIKKLGDIAKINYGYTEKASFDEIGPKFLRITDIEAEGVNWTSVPYCKCSDTDLPKYQLEEADIVFARTGATTGKSYLVKNPPNSVFASYLIRLKLISKKDFSPEFVSYYFQTKLYWDKINAGISGSAQGGFNATKLGQLYFPIPPLPEQKRIVAILDKVFSLIERSRNNAEQNLKNAKELFESYLQGVFDPSTRSGQEGDDWEEKTLGEVCEIIMGQSPKGTSYNSIGHGVPLINGPVEFGKEPFSKTKKTKFTDAPTKYCVENDLILCVRGSTTGRINIAGFNACIGRGVAAIRYSKNQFWLNYFIHSSRQKIYNLGTGATFPNVSSAILKNITFPVPPMTMQKAIIVKLDALSKETKRLEAIYQQKLLNLEELKKSILQKAFNGEL